MKGRAGDVPHGAAASCGFLQDGGEFVEGQVVGAA